MKLNRYFIAALSWMAFANSAEATDVAASTANRSALAGYAYSAEKQQFVGNACVKGGLSNAGFTNSSFSFQQSMSESEAAEQLGFSAGGRARFGLTQVSASARFARNSASTKYSVSAIWLSDYLLPAQKLSTDVGYSEIGKSVSSNSERWRETCGEEYVEEVVRGAQLFFSIRVEFSSIERKQEFQTQFNLSGSVASVQASLDKATHDFSQDAKVTISARQVGGDVSKLTDVFGKEEAAVAGFVQCNLGNFTECAQVIGRALKYASDTKHGFPSQIANGATPGPADLTYRTAKYSAVAIYPNVNPLLDAANKDARQRLNGIFDDQFSQQVLAEQLGSVLGLSKERLDAIAQQRKVIGSNMALILDAAKVCYDEVDHCYTTVQSLKLQQIDKSALELPPLPKASFRLFTISKGVWSRADSIAQFIGPGGNSLTTPRGEPRKLLDIGGMEGISTVLQIEGVSLREAEVYFENVKLDTISLKKAPESFSEKFGPNYSLVVIDTTRVIPGWRDLDLLALTMLALEKTGDADGIFYVQVVDEFNRRTRFDIQYEKWQRSPSVAGFSQISVMSQNRFWDQASSGTNLRSAGAWTWKSSDLYSALPGPGFVPAVFPAAKN